MPCLCVAEVHLGVVARSVLPPGCCCCCSHVLTVLGVLAEHAPQKAGPHVTLDDVGGPVYGSTPT